MLSTIGQLCQGTDLEIQLTEQSRYDMDFDGIFYSATSLIRNMALSAAEPHGQNS